jgi:hypothetical protein
MPEDLREQLEAAAQDSRRSVSQELLVRLNNSFGRDRDKDRDPAVRAICFLIAELARHLSWASRKEAWYRNPFVFRAFKIGVARLLDQIEPVGKLEPPPMAKIVQPYRQHAVGQILERQSNRWADEVIEDWKSPESAAEQATMRTLTGLYGIGQSLDKMKAENVAALNLLNDDSWRDNVRSALREQQRTWYGMDQVRRDLGLVNRTKIEASPASKKRKL